jgi:hypothetical protein
MAWHSSKLTRLSSPRQLPVAIVPLDYRCAVAIDTRQRLSCSHAGPYFYAGCSLPPPLPPSSKRIGSIQSLSPFVDLPASPGRFRNRFPGIDAPLLLDGATPLLDEVNEGNIGKFTGERDE